MINFRRKLSILGVLLALGSCTCATPLVVSEIQKSDKKLTCKDVILEINEAEHYKGLAKNERGIGFGNALMPVCWATSYVDASRAIDAANARVAYLGKIYDVLDCGGKSDLPEVSSGAMPPPYIDVQPQSQAQQYSGQQASYPPPQERQIQPAPPVYQAPRVDEAASKDAHQHIDRLGKVYTHSHPYTGPHRHIEDN